MIEKISGDFSRSIAKALGETKGRSLSRITADKTGKSMGTVHFFMGLAFIGVLTTAIISSRK